MDQSLQDASTQLMVLKLSVEIEPRDFAGGVRLACSHQEVSLKAPIEDLGLAETN